MDDKRDKPAADNNASPTAQDDAQQFFRWMTDYGRPALIGVLVAAVVVLGTTTWRSQKQAKADAAMQALFRSNAPEDFLQLAASSPKAQAAPLALASAAAEFYAQRRFDEALAAYRRFLEQHPGHMLAPDAKVGVAAALEALEDYEAAAVAYESFVASNPASQWTAPAVIGAARCREQLGQVDVARALYEDYIAANPDSAWLPQVESGLLFLGRMERAKRAAGALPPAVVFDSSRDEFRVEEMGDAAQDGDTEVAAAEKPKRKRAPKKDAQPVVDESNVEGAPEAPPQAE